MAAMAKERVQRRLATMLAVDVVGYSRLMGVDEAGNNRSNRETTDDTNMCSVVRSDPAFGLPDADSQIGDHSGLFGQASGDDRRRRGGSSPFHSQRQ